MAVTIASFRRYGGFNVEESDEELNEYLDAAKEALTHAGVAERAHSALYDMTVRQLALHYHDNRGVAGEAVTEYPMGVQSAIHQLRNLPPEEATP